jgi:hypothetical protein
MNKLYCIPLRTKRWTGNSCRGGFSRLLSLLGRTAPMVAVFAIMIGVPSALAGEGILFPKGQQLTSVVQINVSSLNYAQRVMISSLQGVVAKKSSKQIFMDEGGVPWRTFLTSRYGIPSVSVASPTAYAVQDQYQWLYFVQPHNQ